MSSPSGFGAFSPFMDKIRQMYDGAQQFGEHPLDTMRGLVPTMPDAHQGAIDEMNRQTNSHNNDAANASFRKPDVTTMKKPLGK